MSADATILIVDDEVAVLHFFERILRHEGYAVVTAASGEAALRAIAEQKFDLALLDLKLKDMSGLDVLEQLRQRRPTTITIIITAHGSLETSIKALRQGVHDYLLKPCSADELRQSVQAGLLKHRQPTVSTADRSEAVFTERLTGGNDRSPATHVHGLMVDSIRHVISLDEVVLDLSPVEFHIVSFLLDEAPRVVSPEEIARVVQGYQEVPLEARDTIRSHIYHIRTKLKAVAGRDIIRTVRGVGYAVID
jgi:DNA-binding response OmpR family regulator